MKYFDILDWKITIKVKIMNPNINSKLIFYTVSSSVLMLTFIIVIFKLSALEKLINNDMLFATLMAIYLVISMFIIFKGLRFEIPLLLGDGNNDQRYQNRHWTTAEINAGAINRLEIQRKKHQISWFKYMLLKHWFYKLCIPKDKAQWGK